MRGSAALLILPKVEVLATLEPGALKCGLFSRSKKSPRTFTESCTMRGSVALLILPKVEVLATLEPGALKCGLFSRSKKSPRSSVEKRSEMRNNLAIDQSRLKSPGARRTFRGLLPKVPRAAWVKAAALNQALMNWARGRPEGRLGSPTRSARSSATPESERSVPEVTLMGEPERHVQIPLVCQLPNAVRRRCGAPLRAGRL